MRTAAEHAGDSRQGFDADDLSGHSLRAGFITNAAAASDHPAPPRRRLGPSESRHPPNKGYPPAKSYPPDSTDADSDPGDATRGYPPDSTDEANRVELIAF